MKYRYRKEEEMKESGVEWIGKIPREWNVIRNKNLFKIHKNIVGEKSTEFNVLSLTLKGVIKRDFRDNSGKMPATFNGYQIIEEDSLLLCLFDMDVTPRISGYVTKKGIVSPAYTSINSIMGNIYNKFYSYWFLRIDDEKVLLSYSKSLRNTLTNDNFMAIPIIKLSLHEQEKIAKFLDEKTTQFDSIISKKEALIKKLEEAKKSLISEVVTGKVKVVKTLDGYELVERKKEEMKESGVEWLGEIPKEWKTKKIKHIASLKSGDSITSDLIEESGYYPVYGGNGLRGYTSKYTNEGSYILIGRQGALCGNINYAYNKFWASEHAIVVNNLIKINLLWLGELLRSMNLNQYSISAAQPGLAIGMIENLIIPFTEIIEQNEIASMLKHKVASIDNTINKTKTQIQKLKEAKQSLISEVVTGKIEVLD